ncbi:hypothetical protein B0T24DRAFT_723898 [Lasiosphaeria ovina]|uniref:Rhodopsin domain-containing protein n=1 Tax=Lasiosphaeria ovina TaxID=92902 RepID=A0AAE0JVE7_9PEZI|nr:hypothetical protein B0T24DRAFT_723898 [Lasiosphaeria ovina]
MSTGIMSTESRGKETSIVIFSFTGIAILVGFVLRTWAQILRRERRPSFRYSWLVWLNIFPPGYTLTGLSVVFLIANAVFCRIAVINGAGDHIETLTVEQAKTASTWITASFLPGIVAFSLPKMVIAKLLLDVIDDGADKKKLWWAVIATVVVSPLVLVINAVLLVLLVLTLVAVELDPGREVVSKDALVAFARISGASSAIAGILLAVLAISVLWKLNMKKQRKYGIILLMGFSLLSGIAAIVKTVFLRSSFFDPDFTWANCDLMICTSAEATALIIACCIPKLKIILERTFPTQFPSTTTPHDIELGDSTDKKGLGRVGGYHVSIGRGSTDNLHTESTEDPGDGKGGNTLNKITVTRGFTVEVSEIGSHVDSQIGAPDYGWE